MAQVLWLLKLTICRDTIDSRAVAYLRITLLLRLRHNDDVMHNLAIHVQKVFNYEFSNTFIRFVRSLINVIFFGFIVGCLFTILGFAEEVNCNFEKLNELADTPACSWLSRNFMDFYGANIIDIFLRSFLFSVYTVSTVGIGNVFVATMEERVFAFIVMIISVIICDCTIGSQIGAMVYSDEGMFL